MNEHHAREEICRIGRSLFARGHVHATAGNISVRLDDGGCLITPTDACLGFLDPASLARLDAGGRQVSGDRASKTVALHQRIYAATGTATSPARCVLHTHSHHCVALTLQRGAAELLPALTPYFVMKVGRVPVLPYHRPGDPAIAEAIADAIARYAARGIVLRAVMSPRLGPNVWGETPSAAMATLEELEATARLWLGCGQQAEALPEPEIAALRQHFGAQW